MDDNKDGNPFADYRAKIAADAVTYDEAADMFMASAASRQTGMSREQFLTAMRAKFPTQALLNASMRQADIHYMRMLMAKGKTS